MKRSLFAVGFALWFANGASSEPLTQEAALVGFTAFAAVWVADRRANQSYLEKRIRLKETPRGLEAYYLGAPATYRVRVKPTGVEETPFLGFIDTTVPYMSKRAASRKALDNVELKFDHMERVTEIFSYSKGQWLL